MKSLLSVLMLSGIVLLGACGGDKLTVTFKANIATFAVGKTISTVIE